MGTQSRVHSASRIKPTFIGEDGSQYQPRSLMDSSWTAGHSIAAGYGDGQVGPLYHVIGQADPGVSFTLEHADLQELLSRFGVGARLGINFTAPAIGTVAAFNVEVLDAVLLPGETTNSREGVKNALQLKCRDIKHDGVSIVEPAAGAAI